NHLFCFLNPLLINSHKPILAVYPIIIEDMILLLTVSSLSGEKISLPMKNNIGVHAKIIITDVLFFIIISPNV
ncbi:MAG: hypothetical protein LBT35_05415, partial [Tannerella sp.]|nr:hypothetical protein [Tannerella sp.]